MNLNVSVNQVSDEPRYLPLIHTVGLGVLGQDPQPPMAVQIDKAVANRERRVVFDADRVQAEQDDQQPIADADGAGQWRLTEHLGFLGFDFRIRPNSLSAATHPIISQEDGAGGGWMVYYDGTNIAFAANTLLTGAVIGLYTAPHSMSALTWYHFAVQRTSGTQLTMFRNGVPLTVTRVNNLSNKAVPHPTTALTIGSTSTLDCDGWIDEMRMSPGVVRWSGLFTPPTEPYDAPANPNMFNYHMTDRYIAEAARPLLVPCA
jgi:hypothetical protein